MDLTIRPATHEEIERKIERVLGVQILDEGVRFAMRAPDASQVQIAGDFNNWSPDATPLRPVDESGIFESTLPLSPGRYGTRLYWYR